MSGAIEFQVNGEAVTFDGPPMTRLLDYLRETLRLTGTKEGCGEGECGACTVLEDGKPVCSCLIPIFQAAGRQILTIEHLAGQAAFEELLSHMVDKGGVQCGACTPGIMVTLHALLKRNSAPDREAVRDALAGNLCRCTGYESIHRGVEAASPRAREEEGSA
jgi:carbon-monoxide dehydrogenase small subunit